MPSRPFAKVHVQPKPMKAKEINDLIGKVNTANQIIMPPDTIMTCLSCGKLVEECSCFTKRQKFRMPLTISERCLKWVKWNVALTILSILILLAFVIGQASAYTPTPASTTLKDKNLTGTKPVLLARWNDTTLPTIITDSAEWSKSEIFFAYDLKRGDAKWCYCIDSCWLKWCEGWPENKSYPDLAMYNGKGYRLFDIAWLKNQMFYGNKAMYENANRYVVKIMDAKKKSPRMKVVVRPTENRVWDPDWRTYEVRPYYPHPYVTGC